MWVMGWGGEMRYRESFTWNWNEIFFGGKGRRGGGRGGVWRVGVRDWVGYSGGLG